MEKDGAVEGVCPPVVAPNGPYLQSGRASLPGMRQCNLDTWEIPLPVMSGREPGAGRKCFSDSVGAGPMGPMLDILHFVVRWGQSEEMSLSKRIGNRHWTKVLLNKVSFWVPHKDPEDY